MPEAAAPPVPAGTLPTANFESSATGLDALFDAAPALGEAPPDEGNQPVGDDGAPAPKPGEKAPENKPADKPVAKDNKPVVAKPGEKAPVAAQPKVKTLRDTYEATKSELTKTRQELEDLRKQQTKSVDDRVSKEWETKYTDLQKKYEGVETELKYTNYEKHPEFTEKYVKPMEEAYASGVDTVKGFRVTDDEGERHGNEKDFDDFMAIGDQEAAWQFAAKRFGDKAPIMWQNRQQFLKALQMKNTAIADYRKNGAERERQTVAQQEQQQRQNAEQWKTFVKTGIEKYPALFKEVDGDDVGNKQLRQGYAMADLAYGVLSPEDVQHLPERVRKQLVDGKLPAGEQMNLHSAIRNMAGAFNRTAGKNRSLESQVKELTEKLAGYEKSEPTGGGEGGRTNGADGGKSSWESIDSQLDKLAASNAR